MTSSLRGEQVVSSCSKTASSTHKALPCDEEAARGSTCRGSTEEEEEQVSVEEAAGNRQKKHRSNIPSLVCAFMASLTTGGTTYAFGLYGAALKRTLQLSQAQLDTISTAFFFAGLFSWIPGSLSDKFGTRCSLSSGGCLGAAALLTYWSVARQFITVPTGWLVPALSLLGVSIFLSSALVTGAVFKIIVSTCGPGTKGTAVGVAKGFVGLGSGAYAVLFEAIQAPGETDLDFLPMAALFAIVAAAVPAWVLLPSHKELQKGDVIMLDEATNKHFTVLYGSLTAMAILIVGRTLIDLLGWDELPPSTPPAGDHPQQQHQDQPDYAMALLLLSIWLLPILSLIFLPRRQHPHDARHARERQEEQLQRQALVSSHDDTHHDDDATHVEEEPANTQEIEIPSSKPTNQTNNNNNNMEEEECLIESTTAVPTSPSLRTPPHTPPRGHNSPPSPSTTTTNNNAEPNYNLLQMLQTPSALLMLWTTTILVGAGTVETNNMGQMVEALGFPEKVVPASLAFFSVAQAGARVATGAISEAAMNWGIHGDADGWLISGSNAAGLPRPFFLVVASLLGFVSHFLLGLATHQVMFLIGATLAGAAFGMVWPLMVLIVGEVFGAAHVGANYMFYDGFTSAIGTLLLSKIVAQDVYEDHIVGNGTTCWGEGCFRNTHMVVAALSLTCVGSSLGMMYCSRGVYRKILDRTRFGV